MKSGHGGAFTQLSLFAVPAIWLGLLVGVSFIATPAKFLAPSLSLPVALDVGHATFAVWNAVEWGVLGVLILLAVIGRVGQLSVLAIAFLLATLLFQTFFLLPILDARIATIIAGGTPAPSSDHLVYIVSDVAKLQVLAVLGWWQGRKLAAMGS